LLEFRDVDIGGEVLSNAFNDGEAGKALEVDAEDTMFLG
jgi:hypothetical protein